MNKVKNWNSALFEVLNEINTYTITQNSDSDDWTFSDKNIEEQLPNREDEDILLVITNVPIEGNFIVRRFSDNKICLTFHDLIELLKFENIPLENLILRTLYNVSFTYKFHGAKIPTSIHRIELNHDETRECIFDMGGILSDAIYSLNKPQICSSCAERLTSSQKYRIEKNLLEKVQKELENIKKDRYFQIMDYIKNNIVLFIILSVLLAVVIDILGSTISSILLGLF
nr:hypothetical protein [Methanobrevibacter arboriphilus]